MLSGILFVVVAIGTMSCATTLAPDPEVLKFGDVFVGETSQPEKSAWYSRSRDVGLEVVGISTSAPFFVTGPIPYPPTSAAEIVFADRWTPFVSFVFKPTDAGNFMEEAMPLSTKGPARAKPLWLEGRGIRRVVAGGGYVRPGSSIDFGDVVVGSTSSRTLTLTNPNDHPRELTIRFRGGAAGPFAAADTATASSPRKKVMLQSNESVTIILEFSPRVAGPADDAVELVDSWTGAIHTTITLSGAGHASGG
jgi:hypothetical protein